MGLGDHISRFFKIEERRSTIATEIRAGVVSFLTMSYILLVNPQILSKMGFPASQVVVATALSSGIASIFCGIMGNLPFGLAPGAGLSVYMTYGLVLPGVLNKEQGMMASLLAGLVMAISTVLGVAKLVMKITPLSIKLATVVGMGLLIALIGMVSIKIVVPNPQSVVGLGDLSDFRIWLSLGGLILTGSLLFHQVKGSILAGIVLVTVIVWWIEGSAPRTFATIPSFRFGVLEHLDWYHFPIELVSAVVAFLFVAIFDISGVMFGMGRLAKLTREDETIPGSVWAFLGAALGTVVGALTGTTPVIVQVETAAGIKEGGRTGLTAVTIGVLFLLSIFLAPVFGKVPQTATAPILILVGAMMMGESKKIDWNEMHEAVPAFFTTVMMPFSYSITNGILFGIIMSLAFFLTTQPWSPCMLKLPAYQRVKTGSGTTEESVDAAGAGGQQHAVVQHGPLQRVMSLDKVFDGRSMERNPSLILTKRDIYRLEEEQHLQFHNHHHNGYGAAAGGGGPGYFAQVAPPDGPITPRSQVRVISI